MKKAEDTIAVSIAMSGQLAHQLRMLAARENKSRSQFVRERLLVAMAREKSGLDREHLGPKVPAWIQHDDQKKRPLVDAGG